MPKLPTQAAPKASQMLAQFMVGLSDKTAGGQRQNIEDLAPLNLSRGQETERLVEEASDGST